MHRQDVKAKGMTPLLACVRERPCELGQDPCFRSLGLYDTKPLQVAITLALVPLPILGGGDSAGGIFRG